MCPPDRVFDPIVNGSAAAGNIEGFVYTAMNSVYQGAITVSSQNMGAGKPQRIKRIMYSCFLITSIIGISLSAFVLLFQKPLLSLYGVIDGAAGSLKELEMYAAQTRFRYILAFYFLDGIMEVTFGILRGIGKSFTSMVISLVGVCVFRMIWIGTLFPISQTLSTVFISYPITWVVTLLVGFVFIQVFLKKILKEQALKEKSVEA